MASSSSCSRSSAIRALELVHAPLQRACPVLVAGGAVAPLQVVELVEQVTGVAHVAAHRLVGPPHRVGVDAQVEVHELRRRRRRRRSGTSARAAAPRSCAHRPPRGGGSSRRRRRTTASWACRRRGTARPGARISSRPGVAHDRDRVREHVLVRVDRVLLEPHRLSSGRNSSERPVSARNHSPALGSSTSSSFDSSSRMRSALDDLEPVSQLHHRGGRAPGRARARTAR